MRIIDIEKPGGPEALVIVERPLPAVGERDVLIKVVGIGLNRADVLQRRGFYPSPPGAPSNPGMEVSGVVTQVGAAAKSFKAGDEVCALVAGGGYSEYCAVHEDQVLPVPAGVDVLAAAALPEAYFTVWSNVFERAALRAGERLLVHGGSSGIGVSAIQLAHARGNPVFATAGSDEKCRFCESLGATRAVNYKTEDFVAVVKVATGGAGVDVVLDMVGGDYLGRNLEVLAPEGRLVMIASMGGTQPALNIPQLMMKRLTVTGSTLRGRSIEFKAAIRQKLLTEVWPLIEQKRIRPIVDCVFPFDQAPAAHALMESSAHKGKILLSVER
jgi:NADPH:quinone reductase